MNEYANIRYKKVYKKTCKRHRKRLQFFYILNIYVVVEKNQSRY